MSTHIRGLMHMRAPDAQDKLSEDPLPKTLTKSAAHDGIKRRIQEGSFSIL